tara:strand:- start:476 stop:2137 length:1662 start_codon:yes stop_codon:yes gene_type:complete
MANRINFTFEIDDKGRVKVDQLNKSFKSLDKAINAANNSLKQQANALKDVQTGNQNLISDAGLAGATLTELGRTISDVNFGIRGVANNLSQLSTLFITLVSKRGGGIAGVGLAFKQLGRQLLGPLGIILTFQSLIALLENFAINSDKAKEAADDLTDTFAEQLKTLNALQRTMAGTFGEEKGLLTVGGVRTKALRQEFKEFDKAVIALEKSGRLNNKTLTETFFEFQRLIEARQRIVEIDAETKALEEGGIKNQEKILKLNRERILVKASIFDLEKKLRGTRSTTGGGGGEITSRKPEADLTFGQVFGLDFGPSAEEVRNALDSFIEDAEDYINTQVANEQMPSLLKTILGLEPETREKELQILESTFDKILHKTKAFEEAKRLINEKYNLIERQEKFDHFNFMIGAFADFLNKTAQLNEQNKDLARASIIASAAAASVGIWEAWFVKDKTSSPGGLKLAGAIATQAALVASTVAALRSLNSDTPITGEGGGSAGQEYGSPTFNVVGSSNISQLGQTIAMQRNQPIEAVVMESQVTNAQQVAARKAKNTSVFS